MKFIVAFVYSSVFAVVFGAAAVSPAAGAQPGQFNVMTYNVKSGKDFLGQTCCWDVPQVDPTAAVPPEHTRMKEMDYIVQLLQGGKVEAVMIQESVDGKRDGVESRCSDLNQLLIAMNVQSQIGAVWAGDAKTGQGGQPGFIPGFNCMGILYNKAMLEVVSSTDPAIIVGYDNIPGRDVNQICKSFPAGVIPLAMGTTSDKEDRFMGAWLFNRQSSNGPDKLILSSGNWPNEKDGLIAQQKAANGITLRGLPDPTGGHFKALLSLRNLHGDIPIVFGYDFNNELEYVVQNMLNFADGTDLDKKLIVVSEDQQTCCADIVRNHGPEMVIPVKDQQTNKVIPDKYEFKPREQPFDLKPFQGGSKFAFDHIACVGCDAIFVNGPESKGHTVTGPFGWNPFTEITADPASWKLINSAEHAPLAGSVQFAAAEAVAPQAAADVPQAAPAAAASAAKKKAEKSTSKEVSMSSSKEESAGKKSGKNKSKTTDKVNSKTSGTKSSKSDGKEASKDQSAKKDSGSAAKEVARSIISPIGTEHYVVAATFVLVFFGIHNRYQNRKAQTVFTQYSPLVDDLEEL